LTGVRQRRTFPIVGEFNETAPFSKRVEDLLDLEEYAELQGALRARPDAGSIQSGTGGCRKLRWEAQGKGKSGGVRVIYYWYREDGEIFLLLIYPKGEKDSLTQTEKNMLRKLIKGR
jgi:hypothetical protein